MKPTRETEMRKTRIGIALVLAVIERNGLSGGGTKQAKGEGGA